MGCLLLLLGLTCGLLCAGARAAADGQWCYASQQVSPTSCAAPESWHKQFGFCGAMKQSPIDIITSKALGNGTLTKFDFVGYDKANELNIKNNGHSVQVDLSKMGMKIQGGGLSKPYQAVQFHLHWGNGNTGGSEHLIDGKRNLAELHIVHQREEGTSPSSDNLNIAVLGFLYSESKADNPNYKPLIDALKEIPHKGNSTSIKDLKLNELIPEVDKLARYFRYEGSLTTPACNETVIWTVFEETIPLSPSQIKGFTETLFFPDGTTKMTENYRPVQQLNSRRIYTSNAGVSLLQGTTYLIVAVSSYLATVLQH